MHYIYIMGIHCPLTKWWCYHELEFISYIVRSKHPDDPAVFPANSMGCLKRLMMLLLLTMIMAKRGRKSEKSPGEVTYFFFFFLLWQMLKICADDDTRTKILTTHYKSLFKPYVGDNYFITRVCYMMGYYTFAWDF